MRDMYSVSCYMLMIKRIIMLKFNLKGPIRTQIAKQLICFASYGIKSGLYEY